MLQDKLQTKKSLASSTVLLFSLPMISGGIMNMLAGTFFMKYATDSLMLAPAFMGAVLFVSRIWDALNDPLIGWLSDRSLKKGKRARWILYSSFFIGVLFYLLWFPPIAYQKIFITIVLLLFFTAFTAMFVPHYSLGAEITTNANYRNRLFGSRAICEYLGTFVGVGVMWYLSDAATATQKAHLPMGIILLFTIFSSSLLFWRFKDLDSSLPASVHLKFFFRYFLKNTHAHLVLLAGFFSQLGASFVFTMSLYYSQYVMKNPNSGNLVIGVFLLSAMLSVSFWIFLLKKFEKKALWIVANIFIAFSFLLTFFLSQETIYYLYGVAAFAGIFAGAILVIHPAALADTIDYDCMLQNKNNSSTYFSIFTFINKSAMGVAAILVGWLLSWSGYIPNQEQSALAVKTIKFSYAFLPLVIFLSSVVILLFYSLDKKTHKIIQDRILKNNVTN